MKRVVVTGMGCLSPLGHTIEENWNALIKGISGITKLEGIDIPEGYPNIGGQVRNFDPELYMESRDARRSQKFTHLAVAASKKALAQSGLSITDDIADDVGVCIGVGIGGIPFYEEQHTNLLQKGPRRVSPFCIPAFIPNIAAGTVSIALNARGPNSCTTTACASAAHAIADAAMMIYSNQATVMIAGGTESAITPLSIVGFSQMKALCPDYQNEPHRASRPYDKNRSGFVMAEGAGILILEEYEFAKKRNAPILCELVGFGLSSDAYHLTSPPPDGQGGALAMKKALSSGRINPEDVGYINTHSTSTPIGDVAEIKSIKLAFGDNAKKLHISSTKSMTGHLLGAAGGVEAIYSILALNNNLIPPTINIEEQDPECDLNCTPNHAVEKKLNVVLSNSFGFGGTNACLAFKKV